jgi:hypothetical protein
MEGRFSSSFKTMPAYCIIFKTSPQNKNLATKVIKKQVQGPKPLNLHLTALVRGTKI